MKRLVAFLLIATVLFTAGCARSAKTRSTISMPISFTANLKGVDSKFKVILDEDKCIIGFDENHPLYGTELTFDKNGGKATVGDFSREVDPDLFPAQKALMTAFHGFFDSEISKTEGENQTRFTIDKISIIVYYDEDGETIIGMETEEGGRRFQFDIAIAEGHEIQSDGAGQR